MKIKTSNFTPEEEEKFEKMENENRYAENLSELERKLKRSESKLSSVFMDNIVEGKATAGSLLDEHGVGGDTKKYAYPILSRYTQKIREKSMRTAEKFGGEKAVQEYLNKFTKNVKEK